MSLEQTIAAFCEAVSAGDVTAVTRMSEAHAFHDDLSPERLLQHVTRTRLGLVKAVRSLVDDHHAAIEATWHRDSQPIERTWLLFCQRNGEWRFTGRTDSERVGLAYVHIGQDEAPSLDRWPASEAVLDLAADCLSAARGQQDAPGSGPLWQEFLERVPGDVDARLGTCAEVPALGRTLIELEWFENEDPDFADTTRCGVFEQTDAGWTLIAVRYIALCRSLFVGLEFPPPQVNDPTLGMSGITTPLFAEQP